MLRARAGGLSSRFADALEHVLIGEWVISRVRADESPRRKGIRDRDIKAFSSLGAVVCAGLVRHHPGALGGDGYFLGRALGCSRPPKSWVKERHVWSAVWPHTVEETASTGGARLWGRVLKLALIWSCPYICTQTAITFKSLRSNSGHEGFVRLSHGGDVVSMPLASGGGRSLIAR